MDADDPICKYCKQQAERGDVCEDCRADLKGWLTTSSFRVSTEVLLEIEDSETVN